MDKKEKIVINIANILAPMISSRDTIALVRQAVDQTKTESVDLDFKDVEFISRSAAHELLNMKEDFLRAHFKIEISFINTSPNVTEMLRVISANRAVPKDEVSSFNPKETSIESLYQELRA